MAGDIRTEVLFYTRPGCSMCDRAYEIVERTLAPYSGTLKVINVESDPDLEARYGHDLPVVELRSPTHTRIFHHTVDADEFASEVRHLWNR